MACPFYMIFECYEDNKNIVNDLIVIVDHCRQTKTQTNKEIIETLIKAKEAQDSIRARKAPLPS